MRPELFTPDDPENPAVLRDLLGLVGVSVPPEAMEPWTPLEMALACDWAQREYLSASDNLNRRRPKPSFVAAAEKALDDETVLKWTVSLGHDYEDLTVRCGMPQPASPGSVARFACNETLGAPWHAGDLLDSIRAHRASTPHQED